MSKSKNSIGTLFLGIFIGIIAGIVIAPWLGNKKWDTHFITNLFSGNNNLKHEGVDSRFLMKSQSEPEDIKTVNKSFNRWQDTLDHEMDSAIINEFLQLYPDCVLSVEYNVKHRNYKGAIVLATEQLLYTLPVKIKGFKNESTGQNLDSLLLDDHNTIKNSENAIIEFWKSPINYQGYKWNNRKLVLFGLYDHNYIKLKYSEGIYYMQYGTLYYALETCTKFRSMVLIGNTEIINKLNNL